MRRPTKIELGQLVATLVGRDIGTVYVTTGFWGNDCVLLVNSQNRTTRCLKKMRSILLAIIASILAEKLRQRIANDRYRTA